jgi:hypothetical protein
MIHFTSRDIWPDVCGITRTSITLSKCLIQQLWKGFTGLLKANFKIHTKTEIMGCVVSLSRSFQSSEVSDNVPTSETNLLITTKVLCLSVCTTTKVKPFMIFLTTQWPTTPHKKGGMETFKFRTPHPTSYQIIMECEFQILHELQVPHSHLDRKCQCERKGLK